MKCNVRFSFVGIALLTLMLIYDKDGNAGFGICAAVFHEAGHLLLLLIYKVPPEKVVVGIFGIRIERTEKTNTSYLREALIVLAGPVFNLIAAALFSTGIFVKMNLAIGIFNLLPIIPLDGGRTLYYILCTVKNESSAKKITKNITAIGLIPLTVIGLLIFISDKSNYSLLLSSLYISFALLSFP